LGEEVEGHCGCRIWGYGERKAEKLRKREVEIWQM
jgi:hypothetical protein